MMNIIAVDDEQLVLRDLEENLRIALPGCNLTCFDSPRKALSYVRSNPIDVAFLDVEMGSMTGLELAYGLKEVCHTVNIIFVTAYSQYALEAFEADASFYLLKPVTPEEIQKAMEHLRQPIAMKTTKKIEIQTFGNFEVFADGVPLHFTRSKAKEVLAYLVSRRGALCSNNQIIAEIWEDKEDTENLRSQFRHLVANLTQTLKAVEAENILLKQRGSLAIIPDEVECDLYNYYRGDPYALNKYNGEFMVQYSWAEFLNDFL